MDRYGQQNANVYTTGTATGALASPDESASVIRDGVSNSEQTLSELHDVISGLERRLDTVLTPTAPATASSATPNKPQPMLSHLAGRLSIVNEGSQHAIARLRDLMRRVEV